MRLAPTEAERQLWWHLRHRLTVPEATFGGRYGSVPISLISSAMRFWNNEVLANIDGVLEVINGAILATPTPTHKGEGKEQSP